MVGPDLALGKQIAATRRTTDGLHAPEAFDRRRDEASSGSSPGGGYGSTTSWLRLQGATVRDGKTGYGCSVVGRFLRVMRRGSGTHAWAPASGSSCNKRTDHSRKKVGTHDETTEERPRFSPSISQAASLGAVVRFPRLILQAVAFLP
jgi:hypothetical protein